MNHRRCVLALLVVLAVVVVACDEASPPDAAPPVDATASPTPSPTLVAPGRCPNEPDALAGEVVGGRASGDVDGNGREDSVYLTEDEQGPAGCRLFLVVDAGDLVAATPAVDEGVEPALLAPRINALVQVDEGSGAEILVDLEQGASTQFLGMFTYTGAGLERVRLEGSAPSGDLLPYGGSVGHIEGSDCGSQPGTVVVATATPAGRGYELRTVTYELVGASLRPLPDQEPPRMIEPSELGQVEEFRASPFGSCRA